MIEKTVYKLQNVLLEDNQRTRSYESMYVRTFTPVMFEEDGSVFMPANSRYDFSTYFGGLSVGKWSRYASVDNFMLNVNMEGEYEVRLMAYKNDTEYNICSRECLSVERVVSEQGESVKTFAFPPGVEEEYDVVAFEVTTFGDCRFSGAWYSSEVDASSVKPVELNIIMPTFKKEDFVRANVKLLEELMGRDEPISSHLSVSVIDNGRTLEHDISDNGDIRLFPNINAGGAGGFARGMLEAKGLPRKPTHLLVMDDDVSVSPESFIRAYNLLSIVNDDYKDAFLSGAMLSMQLQDHQVEDVGNIFPNATFGAIKGERCLSDLNHVVSNESIRFNRQRQYAAFWFCCFPMDTVDKQGLTMPFFVRGDDAEFGLRTANRKFMTMNGICVWHLSFGSSKFNVFNECYLAIRNLLVVSSVVPSCRNIDVYGSLFHENFENEVRKFNYDYCDLMCDAVEDWLRGPEWLAAVDPESVLKDKSRKKPKTVEFKELPSSASRLFECSELSVPDKIRMKLTHNGQVHASDSEMEDEPAVVLNAYGSYFPGRMFMHKEIWHVNTDIATGFKTRIDRKRYAGLTHRVRELDARFAREHEECAERWREAYPYLVSEGFWREFLGLDEQEGKRE